MGSTVVAVVLAAGQSIRLGRPKALLECGNETLISTQVRRLRAAGVECIVVTSPKLLPAISDALEDIQCPIIAPEDPSNRTGNLKIGMAAAGDIDEILVVPVDRPGWSRSTLSRLLESGTTCCPQKDGLGGHPLLISGKDTEKLAKAGDEMPLNRLFAPQRIEVEDPYLHLNVDDESMARKLSGFAQWLEEQEG